MSHEKERKEKNCLNCNARVFGRFCHVCGQENIEPKETAWGLVVHFFNDITHFEGKFITSLRYLFFRPGYLTAEYIRGRRASYMNPVRMYVFTSAFFFILFFSFFAGSTKDPEVFKLTEPKKKGVSLTTPASKSKAKQDVLNQADTKVDSAILEKVFDIADSSSTWLLQDSVASISKSGKKKEVKYKTMAEYDAAQKKLPPEQRDSWFEWVFKRRLILVDERYGGDLSKFNRALFDHAMHSLPKVLFISLPLFAMLLSLLYMRRKQFYYVAHLIFTIHLFVFAFLMLLLIFAHDKLLSATGWGSGWITAALWIYLFIYLYKAMRRVYQQGRAKTLLKYCLLLLMAFILNMLLFIGLFSYSFFNL